MGLIRSGLKQEVELGVQRVSEEEFDDEFLCLDLRRQPPQTRLVLIGRSTQDQLFSKFFCQSFFEPRRGLIIESPLIGCKTLGNPQLFVWQLLHANEKTTTLTISTRPLFDVFVD